MDFLNNLKNIVTFIVVPFGGASVIMLGLSSWLGKVWANRILEKDKLKYQAELEQMKGEIRNFQSLLNKSLDNSFIGNQLILECKIKAIDAMWNGILELNKISSGAFTFYSFLLVEEYNEAFKKPNIYIYIQDLSHEMITNGITEASKSVELVRPHLGEYLWGLFFIYRALIGRFCYLLAKGKEEKNITSWKTDTGIGQLASAVLTDEVINDAKQMPLGGPNYIIKQIETKILIEFESFLSGEKYREQFLRNGIELAEFIQKYEKEYNLKKKS
jgi:hypothetical protein